MCSRVFRLNGKFTMHPKYNIVFNYGVDITSENGRCFVYVFTKKICCQHAPVNQLQVGAHDSLA